MQSGDSGNAAGGARSGRATEAPASVHFRLNGRPVQVSPRPGASLLETLRNRCGILSTKNGCAPQGQCGCCLALVDGQTKTDCAVPVELVEGKDVLTLEGVPADERRLIARCFVAAAGLQCGFCIPGIALRAKHLVDRNPQPSRADIAKALDGNLCRCTGYVKIVEAVELLARVRRGGEMPADKTAGRVGDRLARYNGQELALGDRPYVDDLTRPGLLHGALVLSPPRGRVCCAWIPRALAHPGVVAVVTARDGGRRWYG